MDRPNIFDFATSELSQDAFFCWLIQWADQAYADNELHECAQKFLGMLLEDPDNTVINIKKVEINKQWKNIDIRVTINDEFVIIIEDKIHAKEHDQQLKTYENEIEICSNAKNMKRIIFIFMKTGTMSDHEKNLIKNNYPKWKIIERRDILNILKNFKDTVSSDFFNDYLNQLDNQDKSENKYIDTLVENWDYRATKGFFKRLESELNEWISWDWVNNPSGGFLGCWWHWTTYKELNISYYLQINKTGQAFDLYIKIDANELEKEERKNIRDQAIKHLDSQLSEKEKKSITHPKKLSTGNYMSIKLVNQSYWLIRDKGFINVPETVQKLNEVADILNRITNNKG